MKKPIALLLVLMLCLGVCSALAESPADTKIAAPSISNFSEIAPLKKVLLQKPGDEFLNLTPNTLERLLFDDIPYLKTAREEHDTLADILRSEGVEVV